MAGYSCCIRHANPNIYNPILILSIVTEYSYCYFHRPILWYYGVYNLLYFVCVIRKVLWITYWTLFRREQRLMWEKELVSVLQGQLEVSHL